MISRGVLTMKHVQPMVWTWSECSRMVSVKIFTRVLFIFMMTLLFHVLIFSPCSACQKICQGRMGSSRPTTPNHFVPRYPGYVPSPTNGYVQSISASPHSPGSNNYQVSAKNMQTMSERLMKLFHFAGFIAASHVSTSELLCIQGKNKHNVANRAKISFYASELYCVLMSDYWLFCFSFTTDTAETRIMHNQ